MGRATVLVTAAVMAATAGEVAAGPPPHARHVSLVTEARPRRAERTRRDPLAGARRVTGRERPYHVAFTFDDGPSHETTPAVLEALAAHDVPAAFFVVGRRFSGTRGDAGPNAAVLADIARRGHLIGNHTMRHEDLSTVSGLWARATIVRNQEAIARRLGARPTLFRPPFGRLGRAGGYLRSRGMTVVGWSIDPRDFDGEHTDSLRARVVKEVVRNRGGVVLLHDTKPWTAEALPGILGDLEGENCRRRAAGERLIVPVSLHYFLRERNGKRRAVPAAVAARTKRYVSRLAGRCAVRRRVDKTARPH